jgi:hypothetical protein
MDDFRSERAKHGLLVAGRIGRHDDDAPIASHRAHDRQADAGIAGARFHDRRARLHTATHLGFRDHREGGAVLDASSRRVELELRENLCATVRDHAPQSHEGGAADGAEHVVVDHGVP